MAFMREWAYIFPRIYFLGTKIPCTSILTRLYPQTFCCEYGLRPDVPVSRIELFENAINSDTCDAEAL